MTQLKAATRLTASFDPAQIITAFQNYFGAGKCKVANETPKKVTFIITGEASIEMLMHPCGKAGVNGHQVHIIPSGEPHSIALEVRVG